MKFKTQHPNFLKIWTAILILSAMALLISGCPNPFEPEKELRLQIKNGSYRIEPGTNDSTIFICIEFDLQVSGKACKIGGYEINYGDGSHSGLYFYSAMSMEPGENYKMDDRFQHQKSNPEPVILKVQGYLPENEAEIDERLFDRKILGRETIEPVF